MADPARAVDLELGSGRNVPSGVAHLRLAQQCGVRPRLSASEFSRLGNLSRGYGRDRADRDLGNGTCGNARSTIRDLVLIEHLPAMDRAAGSAFDGRVPRDQ